MKEVAVIGAGIFGVSCALELSKHYRVTIFEKNGTVLGGASYGNQNRFHYGYHYPRSVLTGRECLDSLDSFTAQYGDGIVTNFRNYYCIAKANSKVTPQEYLAFCHQLSLPFKFEWPSSKHLNRSMVDMALLVPEPIFDIFLLRKIALRRLSKSKTISLQLNTSVVGGRNVAHKKVLAIAKYEKRIEREFSYIVNATYGNLNDISDWFEFPKRVFQYELVEIPVVTLPEGSKVGLTIMDGPFCSILPFGRSRNTLLYHAEKSVLDTSVSTKYRINDCINSRYEEIIEESSVFIPILKRAKYLYSIIVVRTVDPNSEMDDARRSEIISHGFGCWSVFSGKIVTACNIAKSLTNQVCVFEHDARVSDASRPFS